MMEVREMFRVVKWISYLTLLMALGLAAFTVLDGYNPCMGWLTSEASKLFIGMFCIFSACTSVLIIFSIGRNGKKSS